MAYDPNNLSALSYANGFTFWHYKTTDDDAGEVAAAGYFKDAAAMLRRGDFICVNAATRSGLLLVESSGCLTVRTAALVATNDTNDPEPSDER